MKTKKSKFTVGVAVVCLSLLGGGWIVTRSHAAADAAAIKQAADNEMQRLLTDRVDSATKALRAERFKLNAGKSTFEAVYQTARRLRDAEMELSMSPDGQIAALTKHVALMQQLEADAVKRVEVGVLPVGDDEAPRYCRLTAELELLRAKRAADDSTRPKAESVERAMAALRAEQTRFDAGKSTLFHLCQVAKDLRNVEVQTSASAAQRIAAHKRHVALIRQLKDETDRRIEAGITAPLNGKLVAQELKEAEAELQRAQDSK